MLTALPLQTYLGTLAMSLSGSLGAMRSLRQGSPGWNPSLQGEWEALRVRILQKNQEELERELQKQIAEKLAAYISTIPALCSELNNYKRTEENIPVVWSEGSSALFRYPPSGSGCQPSGNENYSAKSAPILIIPSLINRHYILDLESGNSFVKYLAGHGVDAYLASWGEPQESELGFSLGEYVAQVRKMVDVIYHETGQAPVLAGYCMGGLLSLAAAVSAPGKIKAIAFFATPWDFHADDFPRFRLNEQQAGWVGEVISGCRSVPAAAIQALFYYTHAHLIGDKLANSPLTNAASHAKDDFLAVEYWVNDGISMTSNVAKECFIGWVNDNNVAKLNWEVDGRAVSPEGLAHMDAFFAIAQKDNIVPPSCALPLTEYFKGCTIARPNTGHVGMIVGTYAKTQTWEPFLAWVKKL
jgi:polyhydroxyalkanoate synthase subunit PhaC